MIQVIKNGTVITMDDKREKKYEKLDIVITESEITELTENYQGPYDKIIDATNKIILPGLINCHTHLGMSIFRATNDNLNLQDWLNHKIWPIENHMTDEDVYYTTLLSCIEMIKTGTTTSNDMYFGVGGSLKAIEETKVRSVFSRCLTGKDSDSKKRIEEFKSLIKENQGKDLLTFTVTPHSMYTCSKEDLLEYEKIATEFHLPIHMHYSENQSEVEGIIKEYQTSPAQALKDLGYLNHKLILAHGTFISEEDQKILASYDVSIATNPVSNLNLGCGIADLVQYKKNGINLCLGTDGQGSGNNLNMFYHMSVVDQLQKAKYQDPTVMGSYDVLKMATINGAKALNLENKIGSIEKGKKADMIILDLNNTEIYPTVDLITQVVHNVESNNVDTTIINGKVLMENHKLTIEVDEEKLKENIHKIIDRLMEKEAK